jgi:hypothetical protein
MTTRDEGLAALRQGIGGIDPVLDQAENYGRGVKAVQKVVREQGQVMSATLSNNAMLWEERKQLKAIVLELRHENESLRRGNLNLSQRNAELEKTIAESGGDRYRALYEAAKNTLERHLHDLLDSDQLKERLDAMKAQQAELLADGVPLPTLPDGEAIEEHIANAGLED